MKSFIFGAALIIGAMPALANETISLDDRLIFDKSIQLGLTTVANLPTCDAAHEGMLIGVTDVSGGGPGELVNTGGGANRVLAYCNSVEWRAH